MNRDDERPTPRPALAALMLASGFCGISYEVLYGRILGNLIGDQFAVSAAVLLTFLLGIGLGALFAHRWWRHLWLIEAAIGVYAAAFALAARPLDSLLYAAGATVGTAPGTTVLVCLLLLGAPAFLVGCSLPLFAGYLGRASSERAFARAYTAYNFGAALTVLLIEYWLLRRLGLQRTVLAIAGLNVGVAAALIAAFRELRACAPPPMEPVRFPRHQQAALAILGVASAVFQLLMLKLAECILGPFRETFALVLAVVFLGLALGSAISSKRGIGFAALLTGNLAGLAGLVGGFGLLAKGYAALHPLAAEGYASSVLLKLAVLAAAMGLPAVTFGAAVPALLGDQPHVARESGRLLFVSSAGNALGFLCMAFLLHRTLDYGTLLLVVAALTGLSLAVYLQFSRRAVLGVAAALLAVAGLHRVAWDEDLLYLGHTEFQSAADLAEAQSGARRSVRFKGRQDTFSINWVDGHPLFFINGYTSFRLDLPYERLVGAYASLVAPRTDKALVLGLGSGATAGAAGLLFDRLDAVEINPAVVDNLHRMKDWNFDLLSRRPPVRVFVDDAIHYVKASRERYSLIINTVTTPLYFSASKLYTREFLQAVRDRLAPDGVYVTWADSRVGDAGLNIILKTLSGSFDHCWLAAVRSGYYLLLCSREPLAVRRPRLVADHPVLGGFVYREAWLRPDWLPYALITARPYELLRDVSAPVNTLDAPVLEFEMARLRRRSLKDFKRRLAGRLDLDEIQASLRPAVPFDLVGFAVHNEILQGGSEVSRRWRALASARQPGFRARFDAALARHYVDHARAVNTAAGHHAAGMMLLRAGRGLDALQEFLAALQIDPLRDDVWFNAGRGYERLGRLERAIACYRHELEVDPGDKDAPLRLRRLYGRTAASLKDRARSTSRANSER